jgi:beta-galactosidase
MQTPRVQLRPGSIWIDGQPVILFSSSLFYFRLAAEEWRERMQSLVRLGYNAIDVYFPWNYHEAQPGQWDFEGQRDAAAFLRMAKEEGLWVIARPGPYICSEWDGGALPASLNVDPALRLRDADPAYLQAVGRWYERILPIVAEQQIERGGAVILLQLENELDFYTCQDRSGMMTALRDMALAAGIEVPLIACSGQGDIPGATGGVEGIAPSCNVYFDERDLGVEERVRRYARYFEEQGYPLCIIETNRSHLDIRRLIIAGAKLVGPYLQAGGTDFGFTTGITNWGSPLAFMTSHYDFGGMLSPGGAVRPEGVEAVLLTRMLRALGKSVALARPSPQLPVRVEGDVIPSALALEGGGWLLGLANLVGEAAAVTLEAENQKVGLDVPAKRCPYVLWQVPLAGWGLEGELVYATAELTQKEARTEGLDLAFVAEGSCQMAFRLPGAVLGLATGWQVRRDGDVWRLDLDSGVEANLDLHLPGLRRLTVRAVARDKTAGLEISAGPAAGLPQGDIPWRIEAIDPVGPGWIDAAWDCTPGHLHLEQNGIYRGFGWYKSAQTLPAAQGLLVREAADVLSLYAGSTYLGTLAPGGQNAYLPLPAGISFVPSSPLVVRAEIWGHANFDDGRLPALRLKSLRGMGGLCAVAEVSNLTPNWYYQDGVTSPRAQIDPVWPYLSFGGWSTVKEPAPGVYYREVRFAPDRDTRLLHFPELQVNLDVYVDRALAGEVTPFNPWLDVSAFTQAGETVLLAVSVERQLRLTPGPVTLYQGNAVGGWQVAGWGEAELSGLLKVQAEASVPAALPFQLAAGGMGWLHGQLPLDQLPGAPLDLIFEGSEMKVTVWVGERLVGRLWLPSQKRPRMAGGPSDRVYLPAAWLKAAEGQIHLLMECTAAQGQGTLDRAELILDR